MWEGIGALLAIILIIIRQAIKAKEDKVKQHDKDIEKMHEAIVDGDADTITELFDELRLPKDPDNTG